MQVYLLSLPLTRHRLIVPHPPSIVSEPKALGTPQQSYEIPAVWSVSRDDAPVGISLQQPPR
jgi:hypothetical protein